MRALVTGGAGFIGNHVVDRFIRNGDEVEIIDNLSTGKNLPPDVPFHTHDIVNPLHAVFAEFQPDVVAHLAAQVSVAKSVASPGADARTNVLGTVNVLEAAQRVNARVIFASSSAVYRDANPPYSEYAATEPASPYGVAKHSAEQYVKLFARTHNVDHVILRLANVYGPGQVANSGEGAVIPAFINATLNSGSVHVNGNGHQSRDFVYAEDVANAFASASASHYDRLVDGSAGRTYNIGTGRLVSINQLANQIRTLSDDEVLLEHGPARKGDIIASSLDIDRARRELSWSSVVELTEGLRRTYQGFVSQ